MHTTLRQILALRPCYDPREPSEGRPALLPADWPLDANIRLTQIIEKAPFEDALWCLRCWPEHSGLWRRYAVDCAERVKHLLKDPRSLTALDVARRHAEGTATDDELAAAWAAAVTAARAAAGAAARDAARFEKELDWQKARLIDLVAAGKVVGHTVERLRGEANEAQS